jgi:hypothetical protein
MDEGVLAGVHPGLRGKLDPACANSSIRVLDEVELLRNGREKAGDLVAPEVEQTHIE